MMEPFGLIAGKGSLPVTVAKTAKERGRTVTAIAFQSKAADALKPFAAVHLLGLGQADSVIKAFKDAGVKDVCFIGKVEKAAVFQNLKFDMRAAKLLGRLLTNKDDSSIMLEIIRELESEGFSVVKQTDWLPSLIPAKGILGRHKPDAAMETEFTRFMPLCRELAGKEIGQTIIVKEGTVLAVEAVEGTDEAIRRGCALGGKGAIMIKASRPGQDLRYDIPTVGPTTVKLLAQLGAAALAVEAGGVVVVDLAETTALCDRHGIVFAAV